MIRRLSLPALALVLALSPTLSHAAGEFVRPWRDKGNALVVDAYAYTEFDWHKLVSNKRLVGFIAKASDGRITSAACWSGPRRKREICLAKWRRYVATRELYRTRRVLAKALGLKWGSYHLARPGDPIKQALHYLRYARPQADELMALDIEDNDPQKWMSLADAERFARFIRRKTGRLPVLYTNHSTAQAIARQRDLYPTLARMNLWYARYKEDIRGAFPMGRWKSYAIWQFQAKTNCRRRCAVRLRGTDEWMDVNVVAMSPDALRAAWPLDAPLGVAPETPAEPELGPRIVSAPTGADEFEILARMERAGLPSAERLAVPKLSPRDPLFPLLRDSEGVGLVFTREKAGR